MSEGAETQWGSGRAPVDSPLRVGVLLNKPVLPRWLAEAIEVACDTTFFTGLIVPPKPAGRARTSLGSWVLRQAIEADSWRTGVGRGLTREVQAPFLTLTLTDLAPGGVARICARLGLDLLLLACDLPYQIEAELSRCLPLGLCQIVTEHRNAVLQSCAGAATLAAEHPILKTDFVLRQGDQTRIICHAENRLHRNALSINAERLLRPTRSLLRDALNKIRNSRGSLAGEPGREDRLQDDVAAKQPRLSESMTLITKVVRRIGSNLYLPKFREQWAVGVLGGTNPDGLNRDPDYIRWADCDPTSFLADPFPIQHQGVTYVFVEQLPYSTGKGHISVMVLGADGVLSKPVKVLESEHHLSFPFVFERDGRFFMIPERSAGGSIMLYESSSFPSAWCEAGVLVPNFPGVDTALHEQNGLIWLFTSSADNLCEDSNLHLFSAPSLSGPFTPHRLNPVSNGLKGSRMAGALFHRDGALYRPTQNCVKRYGHSVSLNRIEELSADSFREVPTRRIVPNPRSSFPLALHTINFSGGMTVVDGLRMTSG